MRKYSPSGKFPPAALITMLLTIAIGGAVFGAIMWASENFIGLYLVLFYPLVAGGLGGALYAGVVEGQKVRNPLIAFVVGLLMGVSTYGTYHALGYYVTFRNDVQQLLADEGVKDVTVDDAINLILQDEVNDTGFIGYMKLSADIGMSIQRVGSATPSTGSQNPIRGDIMYAYWAGEALIVSLFAAFMAAGAAGKPFDEGANAWFDKEQIIACAPTKSRKELQNALKNGDFTAAGRIAVPQALQPPCLTIAVQRSPDPNATDAVMNLNQVTYYRGQPQSRKITGGIVSTGDIKLLLDTMGVPPAGSAPAQP